MTVTRTGIGQLFLQAGSYRGLTGVHGGATRAVTMGREGVVASNHWFASQEALGILKAGGNAFDAAVCAAALVAVVEPFMSGVGGSGGAVCFDAQSRECSALDFHAFAPTSADASRWADLADMRDDPASALVPGVVAGWGALVDRYGTMPLSSLLAPAIDAARRGVVVSILCAHQIAKNAERLQRSSAAADVFMPGGSPLRAGDVLVQDDLARSLEEIARDGADVFYAGALAERLAREIEEAGGWITSQDLSRASRAAWTPTISATYRGHPVHTLPTPYLSFQLLETLRILEGAELASWAHNGVDHLHYFIESAKLAIDDLVNYRPSEPVDDQLVASLLADEHIKRRQAQIDVRKAIPLGGESGGPSNGKATQHTTHLVAADYKGNLVSLTQTLGYYFGSCFMAPGTGVLLNNMLFFGDLNPESRTALRPGLPISSPIAPSIVLDLDGEPLFAVGTPGGFGIPKTTAQMISNIIDYGMHPQAAVEAPRVRMDEGVYVAYESRISPEVAAGLTERGHACHDAGPWVYDAVGGRSIHGLGSIALRDSRSQVLLAGADPRGDGAAAGV